MPKVDGAVSEGCSRKNHVSDTSMPRIIAVALLPAHYCFHSQYPSFVVHISEIRFLDSEWESTPLKPIE